MKKFGIILGLASIGWLAYASTVYRFEVPKLDAERILFNFSFPAGACQLYAQTQHVPIQIQGHMEASELQQVNFLYEPHGKDYLVTFGLYSQSQLTMSELRQSYASRSWEVLLDPAETFGLKLQYGMGRSVADLSGLKISHLHLQTGHADVAVRYAPDRPNTMEMEEFQATVDYGVLRVDRLDLAKPRVFRAEVGVGELQLGFSPTLQRSCHATVNVGAGKLKAKLPNAQHRIRLKIDDSLVASVSLPDGFQRHQGYWVNQAYLQQSSGHLLSFDVSVSMGSVSFYW
jgi:hypothetical protein